MKKITIRRADYKRKRRHFFDRQHHVEKIEETAVQSAAQPVEHDEETAHVNHHHSVEDENIMPTVDNKMYKKEHQRSWLWLLLPLGMLIGIALMTLFNMLFMKQHDDKEQKHQVNSTVEAVQNAKDDVVSVVNLQKSTDLLAAADSTADPEQIGVGSGVIYKLTKKKAYIVTNYHVIKDAQTIEVTPSSNEKLIAEVIGTDVWTDLAVLSVDRQSIDSIIRFADSEKIAVGSKAIAIGSPLGQTFAGSVSEGVISGLHRSVPVDVDGDGSYDFESNVIQTDAAINPGNSGGALIDNKGRLLGINAMKISLPNVEGLSFAIPANEVKEIVSKLEKNGKIKRPALGIDLEDLNNLAIDAVRAQIKLPDSISKGVIITKIEPASSAEKAGLLTKDVITQLDGQTIKSLVQFRKILYYDKKIGDTLAITYIRQGKEQTVNAKLK